MVCYGDQGQPPPIAGVMPHNWLRENAYYEEIETEHREGDEELKDLKTVADSDLELRGGGGG